MISSLGFSLRVDEDLDVPRSNFKDWRTRLSGMYAFCKHLGAASACGTDKSPASATCFVRGEGLTRIALRKYTAFGVHLAVKHLGAWPSIHPNINRFSVTLQLSISEPGLAYKLIAAATTPTTTADPPENSAPITHLLVVKGSYADGVSVSLIAAESTPFIHSFIALAEGCKNEPQHAGISACISGSVLHLSPEVCTCRRLQKRTPARRYKCMRPRVRSPRVPGGVHLQKAAKTNRSTQV